MFSWFKKKPIDETVKEFLFGNLKIIIYSDKRWLHRKMAEKGVYRKSRGYYFNDTVHSIKDEWVLGHEMFHVLGLIEVYK